MSDLKEKGRQIGEALRLIDFFYSMEALARLPAYLFPEYVPDAQRMYNRGEVVRIGNVKYLLQNWGRIDLDKPPPVNPLCKLFRDDGRYEWVREEYCSKGFERYWENPDRPQDTGWYRVVADNAGDNNTAPPNIPAVWEKITG